MFPPQQFTRHGLSPPGALQVTPAPPQINAVIGPTSSASTSPGELPGVPGRHPISLPMQQFQAAADPRRMDVAGIADLPPLPHTSYDQEDADYESDDLSGLGGAIGKTPISLKKTGFSLKQFANWMG